MKKDKDIIELEKKAKIKDSMSEMQSFVTKSEEKKNELFEKAKKAKTKNDKASYRLACLGLANIIAAKNKAEQMILSMDVILTLKDVSKMTAGFLECMGSLCNDVSSLAKNNSFSKVGKEFNKAMSYFEKQSDGLNTLLDDTTINLENMDIGAGVSDAIIGDIEKMIERELIDDENNYDRAIEDKLEELRKGNKV